MSEPTTWNQWSIPGWCHRSFLEEVRIDALAQLDALEQDDIATTTRGKIICVAFFTIAAALPTLLLCPKIYRNVYQVELAKPGATEWGATVTAVAIPTVLLGVLCFAGGVVGKAVYLICVEDGCCNRVVETAKRCFRSIGARLGFCSQNNSNGYSQVAIDQV